MPIDHEKMPMAANARIASFVNFLIDFRWWLLGLAVVVAVAAWWPARQMRFDRSIEKMFAPGDPLLVPYERLKRDFGGNEVVLAVYADEDLLTPSGEGIDRVEAVSRRMKQVKGVRDVLSLAQINDLMEQFDRGKRIGNILNIFRREQDAKKWQGPAILNPESKLAAEYRELFSGYTHATDGRTAAVVCMLEPEGRARAGSDERHATIDELRRIIENLPDNLPPGVLAGEPVMVVEGFDLLEKDGDRLSTWTLGLMGLTVLAIFRSLRWLIVPIAVVQWTLITTRAVLVLSGLQLSMVSSMLAAMITVVGVAAVMHLVVHIRELRTEGISPRETLFRSGVLLGGPIIGAVLTDASGFGSLWWASVEPVRDFGTMMVVGALLVFPALCLLVPAMALVGSRDLGPTKPGWGEGWLGRRLLRSVDLIHDRPRTVAIVTLVVSLIAAIGAVRLEVETDFTRNFRRGSRVVESYEFVETRLGGAGVWDVVIPAPAVLDQDYLARVRRLEEKLRAIRVPTADGKAEKPGLTKVISLVDTMDAADVDPTVAALTPTAELRAQGLAAAMPTFAAALRKPADDSGPSRLRIMLRARERQPAEQKRFLIEEVTRLAQEEFPAEGESSGAEVTGFFVLLTNLIESIVRDQWVTFGISTGAIFVMIWIGFRNWKYALISLIPNAVPIYIVMGLLGWVGLKMNMGAAMIAAVSMGMSVDSSIHYFSSFRHARREGKTVRQSLVQVQQSVGLAMIFTTIALLVGFGVLVTSDFIPTVYFGALMSLAMLGGLAGNLIVLPLLLSWVERD